MFLQIAISTPLNQLFDYLLPDKGPAPQPGQRVRVPFGRTEKIGIIVSLPESSAVPQSRLRKAIEILDAEPLLDTATMELLSWSAAYYQFPPGDVFAAALPATLRRGATAPLVSGSSKIDQIVSSLTRFRVAAMSAGVDI